MGVMTTAEKAGYDSHVIDATKHRLINDTGTATTELFSASKIISDLAGKSDTTHNHTGVYEPADATILKDADIGVSVEAYDATILKDADIGSTVQAYDATILVDADIGSTVQAYDADTTKNDALNTFTVSQRGTLTTDNDGSFDMNITNRFKCTPTGNFTLTFTNIASQGGTIILDNSGGHTVSAAATTKVDSNLLATISAAGIYALAYESDGTNVYVTGSQALA